MDVINEYMEQVKDAGLYPDKFIVHGKQGVWVDVENENTGQRQKSLSFCSNDLLGLGQSPLVKQASIEAIAQYGTSNSSCSVLSGRIDLHRQLEQEISEFKQIPHTQLFLNAWMALQAFMDAFCHLGIPVEGFSHSRETVIFTDVLNHGCIISAVANADNRSGKMFSHSPKVRVKPYRHCDLKDLARKLDRHVKPNDRVIVISDAVFSMEGDIVPLPELVELLASYPGSVLMMDEAHASGSIGPTGKGIYEHFSLSPKQVIEQGIHPIIMTTFSKFAGSAGAAISSYSKQFIDLLDCSPTSIGTISLPPAVTAAALASIRQVHQQPELVQKLQHNSHYLRSKLIQAGFKLMGETNIIPLLLPKEINPKIFAHHLMEKHHIWISPIWFIAKPRLRITVTTLHDQEAMDQLVTAMVETRNYFITSQN